MFFSEGKVHQKQPQKQPLEVVCERSVLKSFANFIEKHCGKSKYLQKTEKKINNLYITFGE